MTDFRQLDLFFSLLLGFGLGLVVSASWMEMPELRLWQSIDFSTSTFLANSTFFGVIHLILGVSTFVYGMYYVAEIIRINQRAQAGKNNPIRILTTGFYSKVRHPMTGMFMVIITGIMIALSSGLGILIMILFVLFFHGCTLYEEKTWLIPRFNHEYLEYMIKVPRRYFSNGELVILLLLVGFSVVGMIL